MRGMEDLFYLIFESQPLPLSDLPAKRSLITVFNWDRDRF